MDANKDGKLSSDEVSSAHREHFKGLLARADKDGDNALSAQEIQRASASLRVRGWVGTAPYRMRGHHPSAGRPKGHAPPKSQRAKAADQDKKPTDAHKKAFEAHRKALEDRHAAIREEHAKRIAEAKKRAAEAMKEAEARRRAYEADKKATEDKK